MRVSGLDLIPSATLLASGAAGALMPNRVATALDLNPTTARARAEVRAGLGGTYVGLGTYGLLSRSSGAHRAVAATWLGAAVTRLVAVKRDKVDADWTYWAYLLVEVSCGVAALRAGSTNTASRTQLRGSPPSAVHS